MLVVENLVKTYGRGRGSVTALSGVSVRVNDGEVLGLLGPNGAGKTTLIKTVCGLIRPDSGRVLVAGKDVNRQRTAAMTQMGAVLEGNRNLYWRLTVRENLRYFGMIKGRRGRDLSGRIDDLIVRFGLEDKAGVIAASLSRGMQQKLAIMAAVVCDPALLLLDEPTLGLDVEAAREVKSLIRELAYEGKAIVLSTHQMSLARDVSRRVAVINRGQILCLDDTEKVFGGNRELYVIQGEGEAGRAAELGAALEDCGVDEVQGDENGMYFITVQSHSGAVYDALAVLREMGYRLVSVSTGDADLEERYVWLVQGGGLG